MFFREPGRFDAKWQELVKDEWSADAVEKTELLVLVSKDRDKVIGVDRYTSGLITRKQYEVDVRVIEARTGRLLARNHFTSTPRPGRYYEDAGLRTLGQPVSFTTVFNWVSEASRVGFGK